MYYYGFRYFSPKLGRWVSRDPADEAGGINLYAFVLNNSVNLRDFLGRWVHPEAIRSPEITVSTVTRLEAPFIQTLGQIQARLTTLSNDAELSALVDSPGMPGLSDMSELVKIWLTPGPLKAIRENYNPDTERNRFVYTCKYGWIDLGHFFTCAYYGSVLGSRSTYIFSYWLVEMTQWFQLEWWDDPLSPDAQSAFTAEDLNSNYEGAHLNMQVGNIGTSWEKFLKDAGAVMVTGMEGVMDELQEDARQSWDGTVYTGERRITRQGQLEYQREREPYRCFCDGDKPKISYTY